MNWMGWRWALWCCLLFAGVPKADAQKSLNEFVSEKDLRTSIERWRDAEASYYRTMYEKRVIIVVGEDAAGFLVSEYLNRKLAPVFSENLEVSRFIIKRDLETVLI